MPMVYTDIRMLMVEDLPLMRSLIKRILVRLGFQPANILETTNGVEALEILSSNQVDFIICDYCMEPIDGLSFVRKLRDAAHNTCPSVPVILCSAYTDSDLIEQARNAGVNEVLAKPITVEAMADRIHTVLNLPEPLTS